MAPRLLRDPTTSITVLLTPLTGRLISPDETSSAIRSEIATEPPTSVDYQFWRAGTWFVLLATIVAGSIALLVLSDAIGSSAMRVASGVLIWAAGPALFMLALFSARYGYVSRARRRDIPSWLLRSTVLDITAAVVLLLVVLLVF